MRITSEAPLALPLRLHGRWFKSSRAARFLRQNYRQSGYYFPDYADLETLTTALLACFLADRTLGVRIPFHTSE